VAMLIVASVAQAMSAPGVRIVSPVMVVVWMLQRLMVTCSGCFIGEDLCLTEQVVGTAAFGIAMAVTRACEDLVALSCDLSCGC